MQTQMSIEIERGIQEVFDYTTNHVAEWSLVVVEEEMLDEKPGGVGTTFRAVTEDHGRRMVFDGVVTKHEPPTLNAVEMKGKHFDIAAEYRFEDLEGRTRVTQHSTVTGRGFTKVMFGLLGWMMRKASCKALQKELESLKQKVESRAVHAG